MQPSLRFSPSALVVLSSAAALGLVSCGSRTNTDTGAAARSKTAAVARTLYGAVADAHTEQRTSLSPLLSEARAALTAPSSQSETSAPSSVPSFSASLFRVNPLATQSLAVPFTAMRNQSFAYRARVNGFELSPFKPQSSNCDAQAAAAALMSTLRLGGFAEDSGSDAAFIRDSFMGAVTEAQAELQAANFGTEICRVLDFIACTLEVLQDYASLGARPGAGTPATMGDAAMRFGLQVQACALAAGVASDELGSFGEGFDTELDDDDSGSDDDWGPSDDSDDGDDDSGSSDEDSDSGSFAPWGIK